MANPFFDPEPRTARRLIENFVPPLRKMRLAASIRLGRLGTSYDPYWIEIFDKQLGNEEWQPPSDREWLTASQWSYVSGATGKVVEGQSCDNQRVYSIAYLMGRIEQRLSIKLDQEGWMVDDVTTRNKLGLDFNMQLRGILDPRTSTEVKMRTRFFRS